MDLIRLWCKITYKHIQNMNIYKHEHEKNMISYRVRSCLRLVLNKLKEIKGPTSIYNHLGT
jgi:hypothetical protein